MPAKLLDRQLADRAVEASSSTSQSSSLPPGMAAPVRPTTNQTLLDFLSGPDVPTIGRPEPVRPSALR